MKKIFFIFLLFSLSLQSLFAQAPTQAEIDKMMKDANALMKKYSNDSAVKNAMKNQQGNNTGATTALYNSDPGAYGNVDNWKFPAKNTALLASLPKKIFTKTELVGFLNDLYAQLSKKLTPGVAASVQSIAAKYNNDGDKMGDAAVTGWYSNYQEEALLLILKASANNPDNGLLLNNCAALLNMSGIEQKAIPILKYVLQSYPNNSMLLNNLGQAYAGLGETDTAMVYFGRCLKIEPEHPEACGTAGFIEESKGHTEKAVKYFEKSIKSAYSKPVQLKLRKIKKGSKIANLVRPRVRLPEYFNLFKYDLPAQCISTNDALRADAEHDAFRKMLMQQAQKYGAMYAELAQKKMQQGMEIMKANGVGRKLRKDEFMAQPFYELCQIMAGDVLSEYIKEQTEFNRKEIKQYEADRSVIESKYRAELKIINDGFAERMKGCGDGKPNINCPTYEEKCAAYNNLANQYLPQFAYLTEEIQKKGKLIYSTYFDELVYWHYLSLHPVSDDDFRMQYYVFIEQYLTMMGGLCQTKIIEPCVFTKTTASKESNAIKDYDCPIDVELGIGIGKIQLNCEKFSITGGEGVIFGYEKDFKTKQSTLSIGIGVKFDLGLKAGPAKAIVGVKATESVFITFDGKNGIADYGLENEAKLTGHITGVIKESVSVGTKLGINSGYDFNEGPLKGMVGPAPEKQLNKNVPIYKPD
jgi:tetratricopeptide (TPR) repeat protein